MVASCPVSWQQVIDERNELQLELSKLQSERDVLFEEKVSFFTTCEMWSYMYMYGIYVRTCTYMYVHVAAFYVQYSYM